ncbi:hypothetical protein Bbelb_009230 [Branchiostoma belcheri]|nr:hypothetical protein Bbelb_009230 [Branchiostoma belcheri]
MPPDPPRNLAPSALEVPLSIASRSLVEATETKHRLLSCVEQALDLGRHGTEVASRTLPWGGYLSTRPDSPGQGFPWDCYQKLTSHHNIFDVIWWIFDCSKGFLVSANPANKHHIPAPLQTMVSLGAVTPVGPAWLQVHGLQRSLRT